jgi:hypothetical protein
MSRRFIKLDETSEVIWCHEAATGSQGPSPRGTQPPEYVKARWASGQLRDRMQRNNAALAGELQDRGRRGHDRTAEPNAEPEAER